MTLLPFKKLRNLHVQLSDLLEEPGILDSLILPDGQGCVQRGKITSLERFVCDFYGSKNTASILNFLQANDQLSTLAIPFEVPSDLLNDGVLPLLSQSFGNLTSLSLTWTGTSIDETALEHISTLKGLTQIHLSAGHQFGPRHDWFVDHDTIRKAFANLPELKKFALSRDTYDNRLPDSSEDSSRNHYYSARESFETMTARVEELDLHGTTQDP
ncbi:hypothetical protein MW887_010553 [Aspergillus wentii]|nr:hypothetical protein MW887_010553 [Aspergillus wentii]